MSESKLKNLIEELLAENKKLKEENVKLRNRLEDVTNNEENLNKQLLEYRRITCIFFGYQLAVDSEYIQLTSIYSYDEADAFVFKRSDGSVSLLNNDFANSFSSEIQQFMENGKSIPAFLAAVTLNLFNQKTFG
ncbi:Mitotic spindle assembly checkpoint protein MAD1 [Nosema granulosis]|uniref:Spindle assembly checkpoint component MAD1 n=1 Tax=Nosema granulosis TaxID=83296 RepID=A0A9P6H1N7_9MICR|nr:Mitotic spindle assembly checkpoint protein MAD1 [Nosema granulosis]